MQNRLHPKSAVYLPNLLCNPVSLPPSFTPHLYSACLPHICSSSANCFPETSVFIRTSPPHQAGLFAAYATFNSPSLTDYCSRFKLSYHAAWFVFPSLLPHCLPAKSICHSLSLIIPLTVCMWAGHSSTEARIKRKQ